MRYHHIGFQYQARAIAALRPTVNGQKFRDLRAENARRAAAAAAAMHRVRP